MSYPNLHSHTYYSVLDGISKPVEIARAAVAMGAKSLAITDHGTLAGWAEFAVACRDISIKPIFGMEAYYVTDRMKKEEFLSPTKKTIKTGYHLILLAKNAVGCHNLTILNNLANIEGFYYKPKIDWDILMKYKEGLIVGSACLASELCQAILGDGEYIDIAKRFKDAFGADYFIEVMDNQMKSDDQRKANTILLNLGKSLGIPIVPTNDSHYIVEEDQVLHMMSLAIRTKALVGDITWYDGLYHIKSLERMEKLFPGYAKNAEMIAERVENVNIFSENVSVPVAIEDPDSMLEMLASGGLRSLGLINMDYLDRLRHELTTIKKLNMSAYFLATREIIDAIKTIGCEVGWGRGSAGGSLVCYCLGITRIDPIKYNLLFERFVNEYRKDWPDIDLDVPQTLRKAVIQKIGERFGAENVAHISTVLYFNPKILIRDICRAMGWSTIDADKLSKLVPFECHNADDLAEKGTELKMKLETTPEGRLVWDRMVKMLGIPRHVGVHASGIVISNKPIVDQLPIRIEGDKRIVQYPMHFHRERDRKESVSILEKFGLLKFDMLGLKTLDIIFNTAREVGIEINNITLNDPKVIGLICEGRVAGVFQLDDHKQAINICKRMQPQNIEEIAALLALNRPGMLDSGELEIYLTRRFSSPVEEWYLHPSLKQVLSESYGVCVYQEDMMRMVQAYAGYTLSEAEELRKAIGKKDKALVEKSKVLLAQKASALGHPAEEVDRVVKMIDAAGRYSFNKCLAEGTMVLGVDGWKRIEMIVPGDLIMSMNDQGEIVHQKVTNNHANGVQKVYRLSLADGHFVDATETHQLLTNEGYKTIAEITLGDRLKMLRDCFPPCAVDVGFHQGVARTTQGDQVPREMIFDDSQRNDMVSAQSVPTQRLVPSISDVAQPASEMVQVENDQASFRKRPNFSSRSMIDATSILPVSCSRVIEASQFASDSLGTQQFQSTQIRLNTGSIQFNNGSNGRTPHLPANVQEFDSVEQERSDFMTTRSVKPNRFHGVKEGLSTLPNTKVATNCIVRPSFPNQSFNSGELAKEPSSFDPCSRQSFGDSDKSIVGIRISPLSLLNDAEFAPHQLNYTINESPVISIKCVGERMTYDLEMPLHHNFIANGIVSHNSHAVGYAMITYACAYLSVYHPLHFFKNVIELASSEDRIFYLSETMIRGLSLLPPDVNTSAKEVLIENNSIRLGLMSMKRVGEMTATKIINKRPYGTMEELIEKVGKATSSLLHIAGATASIPNAATFTPNEGALDEMALIGISLYSLQRRFQKKIKDLNAKPIHTITHTDAAIIRIDEIKEHTSQTTGNFVAFIRATDVHGPQADLLSFEDTYKRSTFKKGRFYHTILEKLHGGGAKIVSIEEIKGV